MLERFTFFAPISCIDLIVVKHSEKKCDRQVSWSISLEADVHLRFSYSALASALDERH
jgi:hypothetical protein